MLPRLSQARYSVMACSLHKKLFGSPKLAENLKILAARQCQQSQLERTLEPERNDAKTDASVDLELVTGLWHLTV